jgi:hypothetical protein
VHVQAAAWQLSLSLGAGGAAAAGAADAVPTPAPARAAAQAARTISRLLQLLQRVLQHEALEAGAAARAAADICALATDFAAAIGGQGSSFELGSGVEAALASASASARLLQDGSHGPRLLAALCRLAGAGLGAGGGGGGGGSQPISRLALSALGAAPAALAAGAANDAAAAQLAAQLSPQGLCAVAEAASRGLLQLQHLLPGGPASWRPCCLLLLAAAAHLPAEAPAEERRSRLPESELYGDLFGDDAPEAAPSGGAAAAGAAAEQWERAFEQLLHAACRQLAAQPAAEVLQSQDALLATCFGLLLQPLPQQLQAAVAQRLADLLGGWAAADTQLAMGIISRGLQRAAPGLAAPPSSRAQQLLHAATTHACVQHVRRVASGAVQAEQHAQFVSALWRGLLQAPAAALSALDRRAAAQLLLLTQCCEPGSVAGVAHALLQALLQLVEGSSAPATAEAGEGQQQPGAPPVQLAVAASGLSLCWQLLCGAGCHSWVQPTLQQCLGAAAAPAPPCSARSSSGSGGGRTCLQWQLLSRLLQPQGGDPLPPLPSVIMAQHAQLCDAPARLAQSLPSWPDLLPSQQPDAAILGSLLAGSGAAVAQQVLLPAADAGAHHGVGSSFQQLLAALGDALASSPATAAAAASVEGICLASYCLGHVARMALLEQPPSGAPSLPFNSFGTLQHLAHSCADAPVPDCARVSLAPHLCFSAPAQPAGAQLAALGNPGAAACCVAGLGNACKKLQLAGYCGGSAQLLRRGWPLLAAELELLLAQLGVGGPRCKGVRCTCVCCTCVR